jgi:hypothetical protein
MEPGHTGTLIEALPDLNEAHLLRGLHARGLLDSAIHPSRLSVFYGTMGLFAEGLDKMKQARSAAIASFSEAAAAGTFYTATAYTDEISEFEFSHLILQYSHLSTHYYCRKYVEAVSAEQDISVIHSAIAHENYSRNFAKAESTTLFRT